MYCLVCSFVYFLRNAYGYRLFVHACKIISNRICFLSFSFSIPIPPDGEVNDNV